MLGGFANALMEVSKVGTYGAAKYSDNGWKEVPNGIARYTDAFFRHNLKNMMGERYDHEWHLLHLAHAAWNALAVLELTLAKAEDVRQTVEGMMVRDAHSARFTIKRPIGGSAEQADPLKDFEPLLGKYMSLSGEVTQWDRLMRDGSCTIKQYEVRHCHAGSDDLVLTCVDRGVDGNHHDLVSFIVEWTTEAVRKRVEDPIGFFNSLVGEKISDRDIAIFTGRIK